VAVRGGVDHELRGPRGARLRAPGPIGLRLSHGRLTRWRLEGMLRRSEGATIGQIAKALDWQMHSVRGAISGSLKKKQGLTIVAEKIADGERVYRIAG